MPPESTHGLSTAEVSSAIPIAKEKSQDGPPSSAPLLLDMSRPEDSQPGTNNSNNNNQDRHHHQQQHHNSTKQTTMFRLGLPPCSRGQQKAGKGPGCPAAKRAASPANNKETSEIGSLSPTELVKRLDGHGAPRAVVLVDCRSFLTYNKRHIEGAVSINCTNCLTKRRLQQGKLTLNDLATTDEGREVLCDRVDKDVVVYDEDTRQAGDLPSNHPTLLVLNSLRNEGSRASLLTGGFVDFQNQFARLCFSAMAEPDEPSSGREPPAAPQPDCTAAKLKEMDIPATQLLTFLYVGNEKDAADLDWLRQERIGNVLNVTQSVPCFHQDSTNINYRRISARDNSLANLKRHFEEAFVFIEAARRRHERVLIHCSAGISRSSTIAIAYIMRYRGMAMSKAYNLVKSRRSIINPNLNFVGQLAAYEKALGQGIPSLQCGRHLVHRRTASPHPLPPTLETAL